MRQLINIVLVHGINENQESAWTHDKSKTFWPKELLPKTFPNTRILMYDYKPKFADLFPSHELDSAHETAIDDYANVLLEALEALRKATGTAKTI
jgi:hypothetical protein